MDNKKNPNNVIENNPKPKVIPLSQSPLIENSKSKLDVFNFSKQPLKKCNLENKPEIHPEFASVLPPDKTSYKFLEAMVCRGDIPPILYVCEIDSKTYLLHDHMLMDIILKHKIDEFYLCNVNNIDSVDKGVWWIIENSNSFPEYNTYTRVEIIMNEIGRYERLATENKKLGGKLKKQLSRDKGFQPIDCLKLIGDKAGCSRGLASNAKYIYNNGNAEEKEQCRSGKKSISSAYKTVKERVRNSKKYQQETNAGYDNTTYVNPTEGKYINQIINGDCIEIIRDMQFNGVKDLAAMITSSPYNVAKDYGPKIDDLLPHEEYIDWLAHLMYEASKLGRDGMRLINVFPLTTNKNRLEGTDYKHCLLADLIYKIKELNNKYDDCNLYFWGHFNWYKNHSGGRVCQGSMSSTSPTLRVDSEYIGVWVKNTKKLENINGLDNKVKQSNMFSDEERDKYVITTQEYNKYNLQTWNITPTNNSKHRHPAQFPEEIPHRLIKLFTSPQDTILDPFCGSGTTCVAAKKLKRNFIGIDKVEGYCQISRDRVEDLDREDVA